MEALLSSIASASAEESGSGNPSCASFADLESQFRDFSADKVSDHKADHLEVTYEFKSTVIFNVSNSDPDNAGSPVALDPALTQIRAQDALINQPQDDPVLQKTITKHILHALSRVDNSTWAVRSMSRASQGWTFIYNCQQSMQTWLRQNSKAQRAVVGESSGKDGVDPVNSSRPAFDCRGVVTIAFNRPSRLITVKYEHSPLHKTVAELAELYKPPPVPSAKESRAKKRKAEGAAEGGKKKKRKSEKPIPLDADGNPLPAPPPELDEHGNPVVKPKRKRPPRPKKKKPAEGDAEQAVAGAADPAAAPGVGNAPVGLQLPAGEAERRAEMASQLLKGAGLDPKTLSEEQFNIFANQSPDLQRESLNMLVKYGAERLRIVHPANKDSSATTAPSTPIRATNGATATPQTDSAVETPDTGKSKRSRKKTAKAAANEDVSMVDATPTSAAGSARKTGTTRGKCEGCKARKIQCSKERPSCSECLSANNLCHYAPAKSRPKKGEAQEEPQEEVQEEPVEEEEPEGLPSPGFSQPIMNTVEEPEAPEDPNDPYHTTAADWNQASADMSYDHGADPMDFSQVNPQTFHEAATAAVVTMAQQQAQPAPIYQTEAAIATPSQPTSPGRTRSSARRTLPNAAPQHTQQTQQAAPVSNFDPAASAWQNLPHAAASPPRPAAVSPTTNQRKQHRSRKSGTAATASMNQGFESLQQAAAIQQAPIVQQTAVQQAARPSSTAQRSPFQAPAQAARAKSRQGQRAQTRTPVNPSQPPSLRPQNPPAQAQAVPDMSTSYATTAAADTHGLTSYDSYGRYASTTNDQSASRVAYQPYSNPSTTTASTAHTGSNAYNSRSSTAFPTPVTQNLSSGYTTSTAPSTSSQWTSTQQSRSSAGYGTGASTAATSSYSGAQSTPVDSFNTRAQPSTQGRGTSTGYSQQSQQQTQQASQQQQFNYSQSQSNTASSGQQQNNWYGLGGTNTATNNAATSSNYNTRSTGTTGYGGNASHGHSQGSAPYGQHHRSMNLTGHTYNMGTQQEQDFFDMLSNNHRS